MAEKKDYKVQAKVRDGRGKNDARRARRDGHGARSRFMAVTRKLLPPSLRSLNSPRSFALMPDETQFSRSMLKASARVK
jgi:hypothetical protein